MGNLSKSDVQGRDLQSQDLQAQDLQAQDLQARALQDQASLKRMQWRCRRGMLELDLLFTPFVETHLPVLNHRQIVVLDQLLDMPDNQLWTMLSTDVIVNSLEAETSPILELINGLVAKQ